MTEISVDGTLYEGPNSPTRDTDSLDSDEQNHRYWTQREMDDPKNSPPHRYLFNCYVYQYHLMRMGSIIIETVRRFSFYFRPCSFMK